MFRRELALASFSLLTVGFATFWDDPATASLPRWTAVILVIFVLGCWAGVLHHSLRQSTVSVREKVGAFLAFAIVTCMIMGTRDVSNYVYHLGWSADLSWHAVWLGLGLVFAVASRPFGGTPRFPDTNFTVESEQPDHVISVSEKTTSKNHKVAD